MQLIRESIYSRVIAGVVLFTAAIFMSVGAALVTPQVAHGATNDELQAQINDLLATILALQAQLDSQGGGSGAVFSWDASRILTWSKDGAQLWDVGSEEPTFTMLHDGGNYRWVVGAMLSSDESRMLTWSENGSARLWDVVHEELLFMMEQQ